jgi:hypothetical protein
MYSSSRGFLPEYHDFEFIASVPWANVFDLNLQTDWVHTVSILEKWLNNRVGSHWDFWAWHTSETHYHASVAFRLDTHRTLFLLKWG